MARRSADRSLHRVRSDRERSRDRDHERLDDGRVPQPSPTETRPYVKDVESNGTALLAISAWGVHHSTDAGVSWQLASAPLADAGRDLLVLSDGRFVLVGGTVAYLFDASGAPAGVAPAGLRVDDDQAFACENTTIITRGKLTRDLGATWQPLVDAGELEIVAERGGCGAGRLWVLARSTAWGYRLLRCRDRRGRRR